MPSYPPTIRRCQHIKVNGTQCGSPALGAGQPFLMSILEGAPLSSRLRPGGDKKRRDKDEAAAGFEILLGKDGPARLLQ
jgi:hypothetical protein